MARTGHGAVIAGRQRRRAAALAAVLALHGALALALGLGLAVPSARPTALQGQGEPAVLQVRTLAPEARPAGDGPWVADALPQPAAPSAPAVNPLPAPALALAGELMRHDSPLQLDYPDAELPAPRVTVTLALRLDGAGRLLSVQSAPGLEAPADLVQHVREALAGAQLSGQAAAALPSQLCLQVRFEAVDATVGWWFESAQPGGHCGGPGLIARIQQALPGR